MRILTLITVLSTTLFLAGAALGEAAPPEPAAASTAVETSPVPVPNATHLTLSPLFIEILAIEETARETELFLLAELAATTDPDEAARIVRSLERLDADRQLKILQTRMDHARRSGHFDLAARLKGEIVALQTSEMHAMK